MVRVWGGGVYEPDVFYETCDGTYPVLIGERLECLIDLGVELGILVWQDFQFACGVYPAYHSFVQLVKAEAEANVERLRHHPSVVIWCGNNEGETSLYKIFSVVDYSLG